MNCLTHNCYPWRQEFPQTSRKFTDVELRMVEETFFAPDAGLDQAMEGLQGMLFLPSGSSRTVQLIHLVRAANDESLSPLTEDQARVFKVGQRTGQVAVGWLNYACGLYGVASAISLATIGPGYRFDWILGAISTTVNVVSTGASYLSTGCYPHMASVEGNRMQNTFHRTKGLYTELAGHLLAIYESDVPKAKELAETLDTWSLSRNLTGILGEEDALVLLGPLEEAKHFVIFGRIPGSSLIIKNLAQRILADQKLETLNREVVELRKIIDDKSL